MKWFGVWMVVVASAVYGQQPDEGVGARGGEGDRAEARTASSRPIVIKAPVSRGKRVVFVVDASESMLSAFPSVRTQVYAGVMELGPRDEFAILVEQNGKVTAMADGLLPVNDDTAARAWEFLSAREAEGAGDFTDGLGKALAMRPDVVWVVSDGETESDGMDLATTFRKANAAARVPINTVLHFTRHPKFERRLWQISHDSGGVCLDRDGRPAERLPLLKDEVSAGPGSKPPVIRGPSIFRER